MSQKSVIYLKDYTVPAFLVETVDLRFELDATATCVESVLRMRRNPQASPDESLSLFGHDSLELLSLSIDGVDLPSSAWLRQDEVLRLNVQLNDTFELRCVTKINPEANTALEGLYLSDGMFCTQCEAEGFRRITFYPDRPDVMAVFTTTLIANKNEYPILLSNGNPVAQGSDETNHWVTWQDPFPKPAYLFALVAGDLSCAEDTFITQSGRAVKLQIYAEAKDLDKLGHAMESLKQSMHWDERVYGREYDLDIYMIVAVDFFNMGAMENKGLNIFNTSCVLAHPRTTTDAAFQRVESVVAHEYFHNWSGNRVTCRDWFQLSLKEGFTVFRDQCFSADMHSAAVKRVEDVALLRTAQFAEDAGPMSHPVRPESFIEISNFYTLTVYEKGAEIVRMLHTLLGESLFRKGTDLYFDRHDGQAVTTDDFVACMEAVSQRDLTQFKRWYSQAGTPRLDVVDDYDADQGTYSLRFTQSTPPTPGQAEKYPLHIPLNLALFDSTGQAVPLENGQSSQLLELTDEETTFVVKGLLEKPIPSLLRGFSAPVKLFYPYTEEQLSFLLTYETDGFARWDAGQQLAVRLLQARILKGGEVEEELPETIVAAWKVLLENASDDPAMASLLLTLPTEAYLSEISSVIDVDAIFHARRTVRRQLAQALEAQWLTLYNEMGSEQRYRPDSSEMARRSLKNTCLGYLMALDSPTYLALAEQQFSESDNMTEQFAALSTVVYSVFTDSAREMLDEFLNQWQHESLVMNQWLALQAADPKAGALSRVKALLEHPVYDSRNPNKLRAVISTFCNQNTVNFHGLDGEGYRFLADKIIELDKQNPQVASRLLTPLTRWKRYDEQRQALMKAQLQRIIESGDLSGDVYEVLSKSMA